VASDGRGTRECALFPTRPVPAALLLEGSFVAWADGTHSTAQHRLHSERGPHAIPLKAWQHLPGANPVGRLGPHHCTDKGSKPWPRAIDLQGWLVAPRCTPNHNQAQQKGEKHLLFLPQECRSHPLALRPPALHHSPLSQPFHPPWHPPRSARSRYPPAPQQAQQAAQRAGPYLAWMCGT
jgi:hypothetical protein